MTPCELDRVRFVAGRFGSLQGLRGALMGGSYVLAFAAAVAVSGWPPGEDVVWIAVGGALVVMVVGMFRLDRIYASRFGRIHAGGRTRVPYLLPGAMAMILSIDRSVTPPGTPGLFFLAVSAVALAVAVRDYPYRIHHLIDAAAGGVASVLFGRLKADGGDAAFATAFASGLAVLGAAMIVTGILDHRLLQKTMRAPLGPEDADTV